MNQIDYMDVAKTVMTQLDKGAFLTVKAGDQLNTMTIGWATLGIVWSKPIVMVAVHKSRYTYGIIEKAADFTISFPQNDMDEELSFCGSKSGRDCDKFKECGLKPAPAQKTFSPIIQMPGVHFECKIVYKTAMDPAFLDETYKRFYPQNDYHSLYFGELVACYEI